MLEYSINISFILLGLFSATIPVVWEIKTDAATRQHPRRKKLTTWGKLFVISSILTVLIGISKYVFDDKTQSDNNSRITTLLVGNEKLIKQHTVDSLNQIIKDAQCKADADRVASNYKIALLNARDSINSSLKNTERNINSKITTNSEITNAKLDSNKFKPPHVAFISEPHNVIEWSYKNDTLICKGWLENDGDRVAYGTKIYPYIVFGIAGTYYKLAYRKDKTGKDLAQDTRRFIEVQATIPAEVYKRVTDFYVIVKGEFFADNKRTEKTEFMEGLEVSFNNGLPYCTNYSNPIPLQDFLDNAIIPSGD